MKSSVAIGDSILFNYGIDEQVPAIVERIRKTGVIELSYLYKGQWSFAICKEGEAVYEYRLRPVRNPDMQGHSRLPASIDGKAGI